jgi:NodT family efflux transporter outer membrane factor (OMF) lipoprotein
MRRTLMLSSLLALTGCGSLPSGKAPDDPQRLAQGPDYVSWLPRSFQTTAPTTVASQIPAPTPRLQPAEADQLARPAQDWWTEFGNAELNGLIETALANNYDLRVAVARIEQAEKQARIADGARAPSVEFFGGIESRGPAAGVGTAATREDWYARRTYQAGLRVNYELDLWGRLGAETRSALELARASVFNREVVAQTLVAETATAYFQHLSLSERIAIAENNLQNAQDVARAVERRVQRGDASLIEQQQQHIAVALIENNLANLQLQRERILGKLAVYLGKPAGTLKIAGNSLRNVQPPQVKPGLPSELLCRRPDIRRAEAQLASASADVEAARANLLPSVALTGQFGQGSFNLSELLSPQSLLYSLAGNLTANVFDDERKENRVLQARARNRELLDQYANTVLAALRDVEDALAGIRLTQRQQQALTEALGRNSRLLELSRKVYQAGAMDYISLLDLQRNVYLAQDAEASARFEQVRSAIDLFKALGGGFAQPENDPCTPPGQTGTSTRTPATAAAGGPAAPAAKAKPRLDGRLATSAAAREAAAQAEQDAEAATRHADEPTR